MNETRQKIISATEHLLFSHGLARVTTREIARAAGVTEGLIYHHFRDKAELIHEVVELRMAEVKNVLGSLPLQVGLRTLSENLAQILYTLYHSHYQIMPVFISTFADHELRARAREILDERKGGPEWDIQAMALYIAAEQRLGRVAANVNSRAAAELLHKIGIQMAMMDRWMELDPDRAVVKKEIRDCVQTIMAGLEPRGESRRVKTARKQA
ncbi:MAG: helix-turn-helix domain containing protein [Smithellaceae bacterium]|nr:helix-turn-helix domain containing protein [Smithellaceae bacterium]